MKNQITVLGSGVAYSSFHKKFDYRNTSGHLLQYNGLNILLDYGDGIRARMEELKFDYYTLDAVFISHFHPDHFALENLIQVFYVRATKTGKLKKLTIFGPQNIEKLVIDIYNKKNSPNNYQTKFRGVLEIKYHEYKDEEKISFCNITVKPFKVEHGEMDAYSLRFILGKFIFTYSGDSTYCTSLIDAAKGADLFICEAGANKTDTENSKKTHLTTQTASLIAKKAGVRKMVLVHYTGKYSQENMIKDVKLTGFKGKTYVASDLTSYPIS